jgi:hypothetical protein
VNTRNAIAIFRDRHTEPYATGEQSHTASKWVRVHERYRITKELLPFATPA